MEKNENKQKRGRGWPFKKMKTIEITQEEIRQATRPNIYRNRKKYTRKEKHRGRLSSK